MVKWFKILLMFITPPHKKKEQKKIRREESSGWRRAGERQNHIYLLAEIGLAGQENIKQSQLRQMKKWNLRSRQCGMLKLTSRAGVSCLQAVLGVKKIDKEGQKQKNRYKQYVQQFLVFYNGLHHEEIW